MKTKIFDKVADLLKSQDEYLAEDGRLLKAKVYSDVMTMDADLLNLLLSDEEIKDTFFTEVDGTLVFDKSQFAWLIDAKEFLPDSYTAYTNKIGLTTDGDFISMKDEVVLDFPYKDCVLEGGQDKDDQKRQEILYNENLAQDEIRRMLEPKVFTNAKRYAADGVEEDIVFKEDDNLIIKGNNLIALSSLLERYEGKVKLIYIDPPYNTGGDSFNYNDSFDHSTWLTFMKNRLRMARNFLRKDGVIFVQCDDNEQAYLKVLMDEIFGRDNFVNAIIWRKVQSLKKQSKYLPNITEYILCYGRTDMVKVNDLFIKVNQESDYKNYPYIEEDTGRRYGSFDFTQKGQGEAKIFNGRLLEPPAGKHWIWTQEKIDEGIENNTIIFTKNGTPRVKRYLDEKTGNPVSDLWIDDEVKIISSNDKQRLTFDGQKPEGLIKRIIELSSEENDIILDFHLGTGTTAAVAHKLGRKFIGIEQMNYIEELTVTRLSNVIEGDQTGISKDVDWQGGGSFVYCELMEDGQELIDRVLAADEDTITQVKEEIYQDERIVPYVTTEELKEVDQDFENLDLEDKKKALVRIIGKNKLYVNYSDIEDEDYKISDADKAFTESFYEVD